MLSSEKFLIKWETFQENISTSFKDIRTDQDFADVTLACEEGKLILAHRIILATSSNYFRKLLKNLNHPHPLLFMRGFTKNQLEYVVDFIYHGEVNICSEDLDEFLALAEELELKGLEKKNKEGNNSDTDVRKQPNTKSQKAQSTTEIKVEKEQMYVPLNRVIEQDFLETDADITKTDTEYSTAKHATTLEFLNSTITTMLKIGKGVYICSVCGKQENRNKFNMINHIEAKHIEGISHSCDICGKTFRYFNAVITLVF
jgi:rubrerythrin